MREPAERTTIIRGIGQSAVGRRLGRSGLDLTLEAALAAIDDAGLTVADIDGVATYPGGGQETSPGFNGAGIPEVQDAMRLQLNWFAGGSEGAAQLSCIVNASLAVSGGLARNVLVYRTVTEATSQARGRGPAVSATTLGGPLEFVMPSGSISAVHWFGLIQQRYMSEYGLTREQLAQIPLNARRNAADNPKAIYRNPLTMADYLSSRMISSPICLFDCDIPADGSTAFVISGVDSAADAPHEVARIHALGSALRDRPSWDQWPGPTRGAMHSAGKHLWERADLTPDDVDVAEIYDGFSILTLLWLEALGFCGEGEAADFVGDGSRIARNGSLPMNTHGGQLSAGRLHGLGFVHEAVTQLRGDGGERQIPRPPEVALVSNGGGPVGGAMLLTKGAR
jgi:acetyl-CoA acetyltransferase